MTQEDSGVLGRTGALSSGVSGSVFLLSWWASLFPGRNEERPVLSLQRQRRSNGVVILGNIPRSWAFSLTTILLPIPKMRQIELMGYLAKQFLLWSLLCQGVFNPSISWWPLVREGISTQIHPAFLSMDTHPYFQHSSMETGRNQLLSISVRPLHISQYIATMRLWLTRNILHSLELLTGNSPGIFRSSILWNS